MKKRVDIVVITLTSPLLVGIYENNQRIKTFQTTEQTSEALPLLFREILKEYSPNRLFFARGPGSFMSIKITYIFLKTLSLALNIPLFASDGFTFNQGKPIRAMRNLYFVKSEGMICTERFDEEIEQNFSLPSQLVERDFNDDVEPLYMLPAV